MTPKKLIYPSHFYKSRPDWVEKLNEWIETQPKGPKDKLKYCGNCKFLTAKRTEVEAFCSTHDMAVLGHWYCKKWKRGNVDKVTLPLID